MVIAMMLVRNEQWVLRATLAAARRWCDHVVVGDHCSVDQTPAIVNELAASIGGITYMRFHDAGFPEMTLRQSLLDECRILGATVIACVDGDELPTEGVFERLREHAAGLAPMQMTLVPMYPVADDCASIRQDAPWGGRTIGVAFGDHPQISYAPRGGYHFHARISSLCKEKRWDGGFWDGGIMHLQFANRRRLVAKHAWYKMYEVLHHPRRSVAQIDAMYSMAPRESNPARREMPQEWWGEYRTLIDLDGEPWYESECRRMLAEHGADKFRGLDLFGIVDVPTTQGGDDGQSSPRKRQAIRAARTTPRRR